MEQCERRRERYVNYSMGEHSLLRRYIRDDVMSTLFKSNRPIELCGRWFPSPVITVVSRLRAQQKELWIP